MRRYGLRDDQWDRVKDFLPGREGHVGGTAQDNRLFVEAVLYRYRAGIPWRDLPPRFGDWKIVWQRFDRWAKSGVFDRSSRLWPVITTTSTCRWTQPSCGLTNTAPAPKKSGRKPSHRTLPRRTDHQDPRRGRRLGQPRRLLFDPRPSLRS